MRKPTGALLRDNTHTEEHLHTEHLREVDEIRESKEG